jgi:hypothetical protein
MTPEPVQIYIGCMPSHHLAVQVLTWSVLQHTRRPVAFHRLHECAIPFELPKRRENRPGTAFSFQRFMVPQIAGYRGRALYLDSDQIVFADVGRALDRPMHGQPVLPTRTELPWRRQPQLRSSVMLLDCARLDWDVRRLVTELDAGRMVYADLFSLRPYRHCLPARWNSPDRYWPGWTALLHYTAKSRQPWLHHRHRLGRLWFRYLFQALDAGYVAAAEIEESITRGFVRPSLAWQVEHRVLDPRAIPPQVKQRRPPSSPCSPPAGSTIRTATSARSTRRRRRSRSPSEAHVTAGCCGRLRQGASARSSSAKLFAAMRRATATTHAALSRSHDRPQHERDHWGDSPYCCRGRSRFSARTAQALRNRSCGKSLNARVGTRP